MAVRSGIPNAKNIGININAAPTPAMVRTVVKTKTNTADKIRVAKLSPKSSSICRSPSTGCRHAYRLPRADMPLPSTRRKHRRA